MSISTVPDALEAFANGEFLIVIDNPSRENEGDLIISAAHMTPKKMAFMIRYTSGFICVPMSESRLVELGLPDMVERNEESLRTAYTISCDAKVGTTTGISASDRSRTCNVLADPSTTSSDLVRPGHVLPLRAREGGVIERDGHTEAAVDLCRLSGLSECAAISEIVRDEDGEMARTPELLKLGQEWGIKVITIEDLKAHRIAMETGKNRGNSESQVPRDTKLLSTIVYTACSFFLLDRHILRLQESATRLGWKVPEEMEIHRHLYSAIMGKAHLTLRLRLTVDKLGVIIVEASEIAVQKNLLGPFALGTGLRDRGPPVQQMSGTVTWTVYLDTMATATRSLLPLIEHKTTSREHYVAPMSRLKANYANNEEVLLFNENDEVTECTITNIMFRRSGAWVTPRQSSGLLNGVVRRFLLDSGRIIENVIFKDTLIDGEEVLLCNAVRGVLPAVLKLR